MKFDWTRLWDVGEHLKNFSYDEEYQRSAVGRYYYSSYLLAREVYNKKNNFSADKRISHRLLIDKFKNSDHEHEKKIGKFLEDLFVFRKNADYDIEFDADVNSAKIKSENIMEYLRIMDE